MANKHLHNREIKLTPESDYFNHTSKGDIIVSFLKNNKEHLENTQMFVLYGAWGSGKSTLMNYIGTELDRTSNYKTIFFKAWEFEKDNNLPLSLLHYIFDDTGITTKKIAKETLKTGFNVFKSFIKSVEVDFKFVKFAPKEAITAAEEYEKEEFKKFESSFTDLRAFKKNFALAEAEILKKHKKEKLVIFIDDLDRCEPENVLNLLSSIKLFFTLGKDIVFFFGCDKIAVSKAVQTKYGSIIASDEYLEKIFDISFTMPTNLNLQKLLFHYFKGPSPFSPQQVYNDHTNELDQFFNAIQFTNPRHLKKILNKYEFIVNFRRGSVPSAYVGLFPYIIEGANGNLPETIITLFFIILHEFYPESFSDLEDLERKKSRFAKALRANNLDLKNHPQTVEECMLQLTSPDYGIIPIAFDDNLNLKTISTKSNKNRLKNIRPQEQELDYAFNYVLSIFLPSNIEKLSMKANRDGFCKQFTSSENTKGEKICIRFCEYLNKNPKIILEMQSDYKFKSFFELCKMLL